MKRYYAIEGGKDFTNRYNRQVEKSIKAYTSYSLGGYNYWFGQKDPRGYYLHVAIVERGDHMESITLLDDSSFKVLLLGVERQSKKRAEEAERLALEKVDEYLAILAQRNNIVLTGEFEEALYGAS